MIAISRIIDAHHHLWDLSATHHYPWLTERGVHRFFGDPTPIQRDYLVADFRADFEKLPVVGSVHIQVGVAPGDELGETIWLEGLAQAEGLPSAIVAHADLSRSDIEHLLDEHQRASKLRGIRQIVGRSLREDALTGTARLLDDPAFLAGLNALSRRGLSFDLQLIPTQMTSAAKLLAQAPDIPVALCHGGSLSDFTPEGIALWQDGLRLLAGLPNVICKISGFGMWVPGWSENTVRDQFLRIVDAFGPERIALGSNFPVEKLASDYVSVWQRYDGLARSFSPDEREMMFAGTAERFYRI